MFDISARLSMKKAEVKDSNWPITDREGNKKVAQAVIFGLGSMFNHSTQDQNVVWERDPERLIITYRALRDITDGEELCKCDITASCIHNSC